MATSRKERDRERAEQLEHLGKERLNRKQDLSAFIALVNAADLYKRTNKDLKFWELIKLVRASFLLPIREQKFVNNDIRLLTRLPQDEAFKQFELYIEELRKTIEIYVKYHMQFDVGPIEKYIQYMYLRVLPVIKSGYALEELEGGRSIDQSRTRIGHIGAPRIAAEEHLPSMGPEFKNRTTGRKSRSSSRGRDSSEAAARRKEKKNPSKKKTKRKKVSR